MCAFILDSVFTVPVKSCCVRHNPWYSIRPCHWLWICWNSCSASK